MLNYVKSIQTQAFQVWLSESMQELGWQYPGVDLAGYVLPCEGWADMPQLIRAETWPPEQQPKAIAYFCGAMLTPEGPLNPADPQFPIAQTEQVKTASVRFLRQNVGQLWPKALDANGRFRWELLIDAGKAEGEMRFASQFWRANVDPSERYVLAVPESDQYRLKAHDEAGYDNLYLTGDWIDCGFNVGCVEAAVMAGLQAASAITGDPKLTDIVGH
ncbi:MAG: FAD-dependent oxidoreductase [Candidatus Binatia bacterium]